MTDLVMRKGNTYQASFQLQGPDGTPYDLTGSTIRIVFAEGRRILMNRNTGVANSGIEITDPTSGEVFLYITAAETRIFPVGRVCQFELEYISDQTQTTLMDGYVNLVEGINVD